MEKLNLSQADFLANHLVSQENVRDFLTKQKERYSSRLPERLNKSNHALYSLKMSKAYSITTKGTLSEQSSTRSMNWGTMSNGVYITAKTSEFHKIGNERTLSDILEKTVDEKYYLSSDNTDKLINYYDEKSIMVNENTVKGYAIATVGDSINYSQPNSKTRRGRVGKMIANTLLTGIEQATLMTDGRIRKLTPKETWRLQAFPDELFDKAQQAGLSDSQLYKQAGNSVTVNVIEYIGRLL